MRFRRRRPSYKTEARQNEVTFSWKYLGHVDPPSEPKPGEEVARIYYLGPNHYPAGLYMPKGYNIEVRPGDDPGWTILRARDCLTEQVMTMWALEWIEEYDDDGNLKRRPGAMKLETEYES